MDQQSQAQGTSPRGAGNPGNPNAPQGNPSQGNPLQGHPGQGHPGQRGQSPAQSQQTPDPEPHHEPVPITITRWDFAGDTPQKVTEKRHMIYNNWAYRKVCEELGINVGKMQQKARQKQQQAGEDGEEAELQSGEVQELLDVDTDDMEAMSTLIWGSLITEDPTLKVEEVEQWLTVQNLEHYAVKVIRALSFWLNGHADFDNEAVAEEIASDSQQEEDTSGKATGDAAA